ncbi:MAG: glycosyltransferase [Flavobacteriales bacterium]|nr:glycosyltransferase [Flavobacteriales bacterium]
MAALWDIGAAAMAALPAAFRIAWDWRWHRALSRGALPLETPHPAVSPPAPSAVPRNPNTGVTLIVCAHNDLAMLQSNWAFWRGQQFPDHWSVEWLVVDDGSQDGTREWLTGLEAQDAQLTVVHHDKTRPGKKDALAAGIRAAQHEVLVMTDADCRPQPFWAASMAQSLTAQKPLERPSAPRPLKLDMALGICLPDGGPALLGFDAVRVAFQYSGEALLNRPYMGVGRNIAYHRSAWEKVGGFDAHADLASGDDDLFVQDAVRSQLRIGMVQPPNEAALNRVLPASDWKDGWQRKRRHLSTAGRYRRGTRRILGLDALLDLLIVAAAVAAPLGLLHKFVWIPVAAMTLAAVVRAFTLSLFSQVWGKDAFPWWQCLLWGPIRWMLLATATVRNAFTSSPTWTQRAPTSRS